MNNLFRRLAKFVVLFFLLQEAPPLEGGQGRPPRQAPRVVLLHSMSAGDEWTRQVTEGVESALSIGFAEAELFIEFMDVAGSFSPFAGETFKNLMAAKYGGFSPALIIAAGNEAFTFASGRGRTAFNGAPVMFCGLERDVFLPVIRDQPVTGVYSASPHDFLLSEVGRIHPDARVFFISTHSPPAVRDFSKLAAASLKAKEGVSFIKAPDYSPGALQELIGSLPEDGVIIVGTHQPATDEGREMTGGAVRFISRNSPLPVYTLDEHGVLYGATGSVYRNGLRMGKRTGEIAAELLSGKPMEDINPEFSIPLRMAFDYSRMKRHSILKSSLPGGAVILNDPFETAGKLLPSIVIYSVVFTLIWAMAFFLRERINKRKQAEKELEIKTGNWKQVFHNSPEGIAVYDESGAILETNHTFRSIFALPEKELEDARIQDLLPWTGGTLMPDDFFPEGKTAVREVTFRDMDGASISGTHLSFLIAGGSGKIFCSLIEDLSERKKAGDLLRHKNRYQQSLSSISTRFLLGPDYSEAMESSLKELLAFSGARAGAVFRYSGKNRLLVPEAEVAAQTESPFLTQFFPSSPDETALWENSVLGGGGLKPVTLALDRHRSNKRSPWLNLAVRGVSSISILPLARTDDILGILVLADPAEGWKYEGLETAFHFLRNSLGTAMERNIDETLLENNRLEMGGRLTGAIMALCQVSELRDVSTSGHQKEVSALAETIASRLGLSAESVLAAKYAGLIHDIGKLYLPAEILSKPAPLTKTEYELVKKHPEYGRDILSPLDFPWPIAEIILQHHERLDGSGYPRGLRNDEICIEARILAAADSFDAMTSDRPYRDRMSPGRALSEIKLLSGRAYDPVVVMALEAYLADREGAEREEKGKRAGL